MNSERHYSKEEVAAIFEQAIDAQEAARRDQTNTEGGLTMEEIQAIGAEVGLTPEFIRRAAASLDAPSSTAQPATTTTLGGAPIGVERIVELPRALTDLEWDRLVVDLRETFSARGRIKSDGSLRQWTNGNLQALVEPSGEGYRLRMRTVHGNLRDSLRSGGILLIGGIVLVLITVFSETVPDSAGFGAALIFAMAAAMLGTSYLRLPRWHAERARQMEGLGERVSVLLGEIPGETPSETSSEQLSEPRISLDDLPETSSEDERSSFLRTKS